MATKYAVYDKIKLIDGDDAIIKFIGKSRLNNNKLFGIEYVSSLISPIKPTLITSADIKSYKNKSSKTSKRNNKKRRKSLSNLNIISPSKSSKIEFAAVVEDMKQRDEQKQYTNEKQDAENKLLFTLKSFIGEEMTKLSSKMDKLSCKMDMRYVNEEESLNDKIKILNNKIKEITQQLNGIKEENNTIKQTVNDLKQKNNQLELMNNEYKTKNNEMDIQIKQLNNKLNMIENQNIKKKSNTYTLKKTICPYEVNTNDCDGPVDTINDIKPLYVEQISSINSKFESKKQLSEGGTCIVSLVCDINNNKYALKDLKKAGSGSEYNEELFAREIQILQLLNDQMYTLDYFNSYQTNDNYYLVTNYCSGGTLLDPILKNKTFSEKKCKKYIYQILTAIEYMHNNSIVHRDLKLDNIMFDTNDENATVKIIDFGDCEIIENNETYKELVGTLYYLSPECRRERTGWEMKKSDMWSIGVILYILLCGQLPFPGETREDILNVIEKGVFKWPNNIQLSSECKSFMNGLLCKSTNERFSAKDALKHEWIVDVLYPTEINENISDFDSDEECLTVE